MLNVIISGAPGSGKGTQSALIIETYQLKHFSTGDLLRSEIEAKTALGAEAATYISQGNLVPDEMIINIITGAVNSLPADCKGIIFDGFPRTVEQAAALEKLMNGMNKPITVSVDLQVPQEELMTRLVTRGETSGRSDDNPETIAKRLQVYESKTAPVNDFYQQLGKYRPVNGLGSIDDIFGRIKAVLDSCL